MRCIQLSEIGSPLIMADVPSPLAQSGYLLVTLKSAALNRRDYWIQQGKYPGIKTPVILGSDGAGIQREGKS
jgi:NADPH:quinone reductase-like Zn-dependent oxidoreductase